MGGGEKRRGGGGGSGSHKKHKYVHKAGNGKGSEGGIPRGEKGIFVTCDGGRERTAGSEVVSILNEYWEKLHPAEGKPSSGGEEGGDASSALEAELAALKEEKPDGARFFWVQTKINGLVFVKMRQAEGEMGPVALVQHIMEDLAQTKQSKSRFCIRLIPVEASCAAKLDKIKAFTKEMCEAAFPVDKPLKFAIAFEARATMGEPLKRMEVIDAVVENIPQPPHKVDLTAPDKTVILQVIKNTCAVSIVDSYQKHLKFNIRSLTAPATDKEDKVKAPAKQQTEISVGTDEEKKADAISADQKEGVVKEGEAEKDDGANETADEAAEGNDGAAEEAGNDK